MNDCIFCKILVGDIPAEIVYEDKDAIAFMDISPVTKGHVLVIPREHYKDVIDVPEEILQKMIVVAKKIAPKIVEAVGADGFNIGINNGKAAGQVVYHLHMHVMPRYEYDNLKMWEGDGYQEGEIKEYGDKIRNYLDIN